MSREALVHWLKTGERTDLQTLIPNFGSEETVERRSRIKNIIGLMDDARGNFQIALAEDEILSTVGFSRDWKQNVSWIVQGEQATYLESQEDAPDGKTDIYRVIVNDVAFNQIFSRVFDDIWSRLPREATDQRRVRQELLEMMHAIPPAERARSSYNSRG